MPAEVEPEAIRPIEANTLRDTGARRAEPDIATAAALKYTMPAAKACRAWRQMDGVIGVWSRRAQEGAARDQRWAGSLSCAISARSGSSINRCQA